MRFRSQATRWSSVFLVDSTVSNCASKITGASLAQVKADLLLVLIYLYIMAYKKHTNLYIDLYIIYITYRSCILFIMYI